MSFSHLEADSVTESSHSAEDIMASPDDMPETEYRRDLPPDFELFFQKTYRKLLRTVMYAGATKEEAEDATAAAMEEVLLRWVEVKNPFTYARTAAVRSFAREKERGLSRLRRRMVVQGQVPEDGDDNPLLVVWEDVQWVTTLLAALPPAQRQVMAFIVDGFSSSE